MGMRLVVKTPVPRRIALVLSCDNRDQLLPCEMTAEFDATDALPRDIAPRAGWKITADGPVYCPSCKGTQR